MSVGHSRRHSPAESHETERVLADPRVKARLAQRPKIDRGYDLPYLGGYSQDGRTIYFDRHFPASGIKVAGKLVNVLPFLLTHEYTEKTLIDVMGYTYKAAHEIATQAEHAKVREAGINPQDYEAALKPYVKADALEKLVRVAPDLDPAPYIQTNDKPVLRRIRAVMRPADWERATKGAKLDLGQQG